MATKKIQINDEDILCPMQNAPGKKCRYGNRCQWLHVNFETGEYMQTKYFPSVKPIHPNIEETVNIYIYIYQYMHNIFVLYHTTEKCNRLLDE